MSSKIKITNLSRDYEALVDEFKQIIPNLTKDWTDFSESDLGMFLLKTMIAIKDMQSYHLDMQVLEAFFSTAKERKNFLSIVKSIGYTLRSFKSCKVTVKNTSGSVISLVRGSTFVVPNSLLTFTYLGDALTVQPNETFTLHQGILKSWPNTTNNDTFSAYVDTRGRSVQSIISNGSNTNNLVSVAISDSNEQVSVDETSFITISDTVQTGWKEVEDFTDYADVPSGDPLLYRLYVDRDNRTYAQFYYLSEEFLATTNIKFNYLVTEGLNGVVSIDSILVGNSSEVDSKSVTVLSAEGAEDPETIEEARSNVPIFSRTLDRAVTVQDYMYLTLNWLKHNALSSYNAAKRFAISVVDGYVNDNVEDIDYGSSSYSAKIDDFTVDPYKVAIYSIVSNDELISASEEHKYAYKMIKVPIQYSPLFSYLEDKRMVGIRCYVNCVAPDDSYNVDPSDPQSPVKISRVDITLKYTVSSSVLVSTDDIRQALSEYLSLDNSAYGRIVTISALASVILKVNSSLIIDLTSDLTFSVYNDVNGDHSGGTIIKADNTDPYRSALNEVLVFGSLTIE